MGEYMSDQLVQGDGNRLIRDQRFDEARRVLRPVYDRFTEGFDTPDLMTAKRLLDELNQDCGAENLRGRDGASRHRKRS